MGKFVNGDKKVERSFRSLIKSSIRDAIHQLPPSMKIKLTIMFIAERFVNLKGMKNIKVLFSV